MPRMCGIVRQRMSELENIVLTPDPRLFQECEPIEEITPEVEQFAQRMLEAMYEASGCGLAAPQLGKNIRMVVIDCDYTPDDEKSKNPYVLINPEIITADGDPRMFSEGCLSFPGISVDVIRPSHVVVQALDLEGDLLEYESEGNLMAVCLQHEIDHLNGTTMIDHLTPMKRAKALKDCKEAIKHGVKPGETSDE